MITYQFSDGARNEQCILRLFSVLRRVLPTLLLSLGSIAAVSEAAIIHESALSGAPHQTAGWTLDDGQFIGSRFSVDKTVLVESVGGNMFGTGTLFAAIVGLDNPSSLPSGDPFDSSTRAFAVFPASGGSGQDVEVPMSVVLPSGDYALIFGSALGESSGQGAMTYANFDIPGHDSYFSWHTSQDQSRWRDPVDPNELRGMRFFVNGIQDPEWPTLRIDPYGKLLGSHNVPVKGVLYDVQFLDGSCIELFAGCDEIEDFPFPTADDAHYAMTVLMNTVMNDTAEGLFDSDPSLTRGCEPNAMRLCAIYTPYGLGHVEYPEAILRARLLNQDFPAHLYDGVEDWDYGPADLDFGAPLDWITWARWTPVLISEPGMMSYMLMGACAFACVRWTRRRSIGVMFR